MFRRSFFCCFILGVLFLAPLGAFCASEKADFMVPPEIIIHHTPERSFIGPGMLALENGDILMAAPWGRPPTNFEQISAKFPVPMLYRIPDGGRTWKEQGLLRVADEPPRAGDVLAACWHTHWSDSSGRLSRTHLVELRNPSEPLRIFDFERAATWGRAIYR